MTSPPSILSIMLSDVGGLECGEHRDGLRCPGFSLEDPRDVWHDNVGRRHVGIARPFYALVLHCGCHLLSRQSNGRLYQRRFNNGIEFFRHNRFLIESVNTSMMEAAGVADNGHSRLLGGAT